MSYELYKTLHVFSVLLLITSLGTLAAVATSGNATLRRVAGVAHGVALTLILVAGFGILARLGLIGEIPVWAWLKLGIWVILGLMVLPLRRRPEWGVRLWPVIPVVGGLAAWLAIAKPFW